MKARDHTKFERIAAAVAYPMNITLAFLLFDQLMGFGVEVEIAAYFSVVAGAALITLHEVKLPYRNAWKPSSTDVKSDLAFMVVVQVALPYFLSISIVLGAAKLISGSGITIARVWLHDLPMSLQVCLMLIVADFPRYWLHRAFHRFAPLWGFHAVHHSPHRLYWLNVGRFHPIEKAVQYCFDALPFALLGVAPEVLAAYFVFYAINGFYQHSNCSIRLGPLNYIVSGPELHRWHHSEFPKESDNNFGNNLIFWDLVFGTRFLPRDREVGSLGLLNRGYPTDFVSQMKTPFIRGLDSG